MGDYSVREVVRDYPGKLWGIAVSWKSCGITQESIMRDYSLLEVTGNNSVWEVMGDCSVQEVMGDYSGK